MHLIRKYRWPIVIVGSAVAVLAFLAFRPDKLFVDDVVNESLGDAFTTTTAATSSTTSTTPAPTTTTSEAADAGTPEPETTTTSTSPPSTTSTTVPEGPITLTMGGFYGIDHAASGTATVYELDGQHILRFEDDTDIQNGPDLWVWVLPADDYDESGTPTEYIELGKIKGNVGGQNYELPDAFDPELHHFVLIWCKRFSVPFAAAALT